MFTGLIEEIGSVKAVRPLGGGKRITVGVSKVMDGLKIDDSVALNGVCQTVVARTENTFDVEAIEETLRKSTLKNLRAGDRLNLERAMRLGDRMGGHLVQGHVDCCGRLISVDSEATGTNLWVGFPAEFARYVVAAGSICIDGVSLTVARVEGSRLMVSIIPHTWKMTILPERKPGNEVNHEFDIIGKYVEKMTDPHLQRHSNDSKPSLLDSFLDQPEF